MTDEFTPLRFEVAEALHALRVAVAAVCPGQHRLTQHRDGKPPWCPACGRGGDGIMLGVPTGEPS